MLLKLFMRLGKYFQYFVLGFKNSIEYKSEVITNLFKSGAIFFFFYILWTFIYSATEITYFNFNEMILYFILNSLLIANFQFVNFSIIISSEISSGSIVTKLSKPINFILATFFRELGNMVLPIISTISTITIIFYIFKITINNTILFSLYFFLVLAFYLFFALIIASLSFWLTEIWGINSSLDYVKEILSGTIFPLFLLPNFIQPILKFIPFQYLNYTLGLIMLNKLSISEIIKSTLILIGWIIFLAILALLLYKKGIKKIEALGG